VVQSNPFAQNASYQLLTVIASRQLAATVEMALEDIALSVARFEHLPDGSVWRTDAVFADSSACAEAETRLNLLQCSENTVLNRQWQDMPLRDWVLETQQQFPPLEVGRFFIHGSHVSKPNPPLIGLHIDAGCAFGTGEHATTSGCLRALQGIAKQTRCKRVLDLGCGTGILAIAAQKLWRDAMVVIGTDMDAVSIQVAAENGKRNGCPDVRFYTAAGFQNRQVASQHYDLIFANILARPLVRLAGEIVEHLAPQGYVILSGLLTSQELEVLAAYRCRGMKFITRYTHEGWSALVLQKNIQK
jgi:ribosomal protein L11 methyltransferase